MMGTLRGMMVGALSFAVLGCSTDKVSAPRLAAPAVALGNLRVSPLNAIMAVGDTLTVTAAGTTLTGEPMTSFDSVLYVLQRVTDTLRVRVSKTGVVTALGSSGNSPVLLNVIAFKNGTARGDQAVIQITAAAIPNATLSIQPTGSDSARLAKQSSKTIRPVVADLTTGDRVSNPQFRYTYHDADSLKVGCYVPQFPTVGTIPSAQLQLTNCGTRVGLNAIRALQTGTVWVIATATVYGRPLRDSVLYTFTNPFSFSIAVSANNLSVRGGAATYGTIYIAPGGTITFQNFLPAQLVTSVDYTFDNPAAATSAGGDSGNVLGLHQYDESPRKFLTPGTYTYTSTLNGAVAPFAGVTLSGQIVVQ